MADEAISATSSVQGMERLLRFARNDKGWWRASGGQPRAVVRLGVVDRRALRDDPGRVDLADRPVIDHVVARLDGRGDAGDLVELAHIVEQVRIVGDALAIALEQREIRHVEAHERRKQAPVGLGDLSADQVALPAEPRLQLVEGREQRVIGRLVRLLRAGEAAAIDAVVDRAVDVSLTRSISARSGAG